jgi:uracil-DNA glycosylase family 4
VTAPALRRLYAAYARDTAPALVGLRADSTLVPGRGNTSPLYLFVGEAPGQAEERQREPFVGPSGRVLDDLLDSILWSRRDVYITNIVKYRPPNNRDPLPSEKAASLPYLKREWELLGRPRIVTLGRHALEGILPGVRIAQVHGRWQHSATYGAVLPLYHPATALYRSTTMAVLLADITALLEGP